MNKSRGLLVLYINLDRRTDRRLRLEQGLKVAGLIGLRIGAVDAKSKSFTHSSALVTAAEQACWMSHQEAIAEITRSECKFGLILEDDVDLVASCIDEKLVTQILEFMTSENIDLFQLGYLHKQYAWWKIGPFFENLREIASQKRRRVTLPSGMKLRVVYSSFRSGAHAYLLTREGARKLLGHNLPPSFSADNFLGHVANRSLPHFRTARTRKSLVGQWARSTLRKNDLDSDIASSEVES